MNSFPDFSTYGYKIESELGHNRAGGRVTYLARSTPPYQEEVQVVIKQFQFAQSGANWADFEAYQREIQVLQSLSSPGLPQYLDSFQTPSGFCMVQEYKPAPSLASPRCWTLDEIKQIALSLLDILIYLQNQTPPVIHRDIKPENILVGIDEEIKVYLVDFGFARIGGGEVAVSSVVKGTLGFMPPEQMFNRQLTEASDLYSLGATLICLLTNTPSAKIGNLIDASYRINFKHLVPQINQHLFDWLQKMVAPDFKERYPNAAAAKAALKPIDVNRSYKRRNLEIKAVALSSLSLVGLGIFALMMAPSFNLNAPEIKTVQSTLSVDFLAKFSHAFDDKYKVLNKDISISKNNKRIYFYVNFKLIDKEYDCLCQVFSSTGRMVYAAQSTLTAEENSLSTGCFYDFDKNVDKPGDLTFVFSLDGQKVVKENITVLAE
ncbi:MULTISPECIES: serine/threonine protein kinase [Cyanophyceae]|uniref:serine/threonine protein kinase n=1 Tax=Cyanophyceae TaxID=3028117 RepID=UPI001688BF1D|nr:serine/threonine-protein kinase [Trichocoleus sp. FACHB-69]MBD1931672.1 serine/threonine protein kinase [Trichocoleus sp. FACHB-69]